LRIGVLQINSDSSSTFLKWTDWSLFGLESINTDGLQLRIEDFPNAEGTVFFLLELSFFVEHEGSFVAYPKNDAKVLTIRGVD